MATVTKEPTQKPLTVEDAKNKIEEDANESLRLCGKVVEAALSQYNCEIQPMAIISNKGTALRTELVKK